ncbi:MAG: LysE family translocator [Proteobacteria bacterium]|nr:LysE family translocator [Pseudomonadota bacterium]
MEYYFAILLFAFTATITPGPNNVMIMTSGVNYGVRRSLPHFFGICLGFPVMVILVGLGIGAVFERFPLVHEVIKVVGVAYLLYLSWRIATSSPVSLEGGEGKPLTFWQAVLFQWVNPKAWVMVTGAVAAFTSVSNGIYFQVLLITSAFVLAVFPCVAIWMTFGLGLKKLLKDPSHQRIFNVAMAVLLVSSIAPVIGELVQTYS